MEGGSIYSESYLYAFGRAVWVNFTGVIGIGLLCSYGGMVIFAFYYSALCDPIKSNVN